MNGEDGFYFIFGKSLINLGAGSFGFRRDVLIVKCEDDFIFGGMNVYS